MKTLLDPNVSRSSSGRSLLFGDETAEATRANDMPPPQPVTPETRSPKTAAADPARSDRPRRRSNTRQVVR